MYKCCTSPEQDGPIRLGFKQTLYRFSIKVSETRAHWVMTKLRLLTWSMYNCQLDYKITTTTHGQASFCLQAHHFYNSTRLNNIMFFVFFFVFLNGLRGWQKIDYLEKTSLVSCLVVWIMMRQRNGETLTPGLWKDIWFVYVPSQGMNWADAVIYRRWGTRYPL